MIEHALPYCERLSSGSETFNTLSNLAYPGVAAWWIACGAGEPRRWAEAALVALIGAMSALFHAWPTTATQLLDVAAIALFVSMALHRLLCALVPGRRRRTLLMSAWLLASAAASLVPTWLNGSLLYAPTLLGLAALSAVPGPHRGALRATLALFAIGLMLRTVDNTLCTVWPYGTHVPWHVFTALSTGTVLQALRASDYDAGAASRARR